jgi:hypothetical protein
VSAFCRHGREPSDCDEHCVTGGHACAEHDSASGGWMNRLRDTDDDGESVYLSVVTRVRLASRDARREQSQKLERRPKAALVSTNQLIVSSLRDDGERIPILRDRDRTDRACRVRGRGRRHRIAQMQPPPSCCVHGEWSGKLFGAALVPAIHHLRIKGAHGRVVVRSRGIRAHAVCLSCGISVPSNSI